MSRCSISFQVVLAQEHRAQQQRSVVSTNAPDISHGDNEGVDILRRRWPSGVLMNGHAHQRHCFRSSVADEMTGIKERTGQACTKFTLSDLVEGMIPA